VSTAMQSTAVYLRYATLDAMLTAFEALGLVLPVVTEDAEGNPVDPPEPMSRLQPDGMSPVQWAGGLITSMRPNVDAEGEPLPEDTNEYWAGLVLGDMPDFGDALVERAQWMPTQ